MEPNKPTEGAELYQEGVCPLQSFSSLAIPVTPETQLEPRRNRPPRSPLGQAPDNETTSRAVAAAVAAAFAGPVAVAIGQAVGAAVGAALRGTAGDK